MIYSFITVLTLFTTLFLGIQGCEPKSADSKYIKDYCVKSYSDEESQKKCAEFCSNYSAFVDNIDLGWACQAGQVAYLTDNARDSVSATKSCHTLYEFSNNSKNQEDACLKGVAEEVARSKALGLSSDREVGN